MRVSEFMLATTKELPAEAELPSHRLMLRAGMIHKLASGLYTWLPLGLRVLNKVEAIVREQMAAAGAQELRMPVVQPATLWQQSGRWDKYGADMARLEDRHGREFCLGPTHEEVITEMVTNYYRSYRQLPVTFYQIQTKFRDEIRPRFGVMRAREFVMKDAYSFHIDTASLQETYQRMYQAYQAIFESMGLAYRVVNADPGEIGGDVSHEFHVLAQSGEDLLAYCPDSDYAANVEVAEALTPAPAAADGVPAMEKIDSVKESFPVKTILLQTDPKVKNIWTAVVLKSDDELNEVKLAHLTSLAKPFIFADQKSWQGPVDLDRINPIELEKNVTISNVIVDKEVAALKEFYVPAHDRSKIIENINVQRDLPNADVLDIRQVQEGDASPDGKGALSFVRGIEVGHIFQNGDTYTKPFNTSVQNADGKNVTLVTGCYGIGISRVVAAAIEQHHDDRGIIWPKALAPFDIAIIPVHGHKFSRVRELSEQLFEELKAAGFEVLLDDRKERPGVMFADMDLIGIPHRIVISESGIDAGEIEYKARDQQAIEHLALEGVVKTLIEKLQSS